MNTQCRDVQNMTESRFQQKCTLVRAGSLPKQITILLTGAEHERIQADNLTHWVRRIHISPCLQEESQALCITEGSRPNSAKSSALRFLSRSALKKRKIIQTQLRIE
jgi:hypothetical protein